MEKGLFIPWKGTSNNKAYSKAETDRRSRALAE
jgi:hypothetical protein